MDKIMNRFNKYQICATLCIAIFIVSFSIGVLSRDRKVYRIALDNYYEDIEEDEYASGELTKHQMKLCYDIIADKTTSMKSANYDIPGYSISAVNIDRLKSVNTAVRAARMIAMLSFVGFVYCFILLSRRRMYMPLAYGSAFATLLTSLLALTILLAKKGLLKGIRDMLLYNNYGYFVEGDIVRRLLIPDFARMIGIEFLMIDIFVILVFALLNYMIKRSGRPHEF